MRIFINRLRGRFGILLVMLPLRPETFEGCGVFAGASGNVRTMWVRFGAPVEDVGPAGGEGEPPGVRVARVSDQITGSFHRLRSDWAPMSRCFRGSALLLRSAPHVPDVVPEEQNQGPAPGK